MAASSPPDVVEASPGNQALKEGLEAEERVPLGSGDAPTRRDPVVSLLSPVSGLQPLVWSEDHRLAVSTGGSLSLLELVCDVSSNKQDLTLHRTSIAVPNEAHRFQVDGQPDV